MAIPALVLGNIRYLADNPKLAQTRKFARLMVIDAAARQLSAAGVKALFVVLMLPENLRGAPRPFFLIKAETDGQGKEARMAAFSTAIKVLQIRKLAAGNIFERDGWLIASVMPIPAGDDEFNLNDAALMNAFDANPLQDITAAFVVPEQLREIVKIGASQQMLSASSKEDQRLLPLVKRLLPMVDADWLFASMQMGDSPQIRIRANFASGERSSGLAGALKELFSNLYTMVKVSPSRTITPELAEVRNANLRRQTGMIQDVKISSRGSVLELLVDDAVLRAVVGKMLQLQREPDVRCVREGTTTKCVTRKRN
jgi:hypothetical protein